MDKVLQTGVPSEVDTPVLSMICKIPFFLLHSCFFENGSQCCQLNLWIAQIPITGTNTNNNDSVPRVYGLFSVQAAKCPILCIIFL